MVDTTDPLVLDLVEWIAREPRLYAEVIETWRTSCPRLTIWEDAVDRGYVAREQVAGTGVRVAITAGGEKFLRENGPQNGFDVSTLREPYRIEGKKTMGYELVEQLGGDVPDVVLYPTGGGTGLIGMWKAFDEMQALGWIAKGRRPRFVSVQMTGCAPVVKGFNDGAERTEPWPNPRTRAYGLRVPAPLGGFLCLRALRATNGTVIAIDDAEADAAAFDLAGRAGIDVCPEGGAAWAALARLRGSGFIKPADTVVVFNTGTGLKYR